MLLYFMSRPRKESMETQIRENESATTAVIRAVSAVTGRTRSSRQPLNEVIDPDALDLLFESRANDVPRSGARLSFTYSSCRITIDNDECLTIEPADTKKASSEESEGTDQGDRSRSQRDRQQSATTTTRGSRICRVCQQPIEREDIQRERGELVHRNCRPELRCGISLETRTEK